jgi:integrase
VCRTAVIPGVISSKERGLKLKTCRNIIDASFRAMVRDARAVDELIDKDPFAALEWPRAEETEPDPFTENERDRILNHFGNKAPFYYPFIYSLFWTGMRPSGATALRWSSIDFNTGTVAITRSRHLRGENSPKNESQSENNSFAAQGY